MYDTLLSFAELGFAKSFIPFVCVFIYLDKPGPNIPLTYA